MGTVFLVRAETREVLKGNFLDGIDGSGKSTSSQPPGRTPGACFLILTVKNGPVAPPDPRFRLDLVFDPSGVPMSTLAPRGTLGESEGNKSA